jgi:hypothetical protein
MDNSEKRATMGTPDTGQMHYNSNYDNSEENTIDEK